MSASSNSSLVSPTVLRVPHSKDDLRRITVKDQHGEYDVYRLAPVVAKWPAGDVPDDVNPRSHDDECLRSKVARDIEDTLRNSPEDFWLANRGGYLLAERVKFDPERAIVEITLSDADIHGMADGATTNRIISKLQQECVENEDEALEKSLANARFNLDVVVGLTDHERIGKLVQGRNRSVQVREWSLADFRGQFDWIKELIDRRGGAFKGKVGWEENAGKPVSVLDVVSLMTLFHPIYDNLIERRRRAPTVAFSSKGTADRRVTDEKMEAGYKSLGPVLEDILKLHDYIYINFEPTYERYNKETHNKGAKLGKRRGFENKPSTLPLTETEAPYRIDKGVIYPLLASFRALLDFSSGEARWRLSPFEFFDQYGSDLVGLLIEQYELCGRNPATTGKTRAVYSALHNQARLLMAEGAAAAEVEA